MYLSLSIYISIQIRLVLVFVYVDVNVLMYVLMRVYDVICKRVDKCAFACVNTCFLQSPCKPFKVQLRLFCSDVNRRERLSRSMSATDCRRAVLDCKQASTANDKSNRLPKCYCLILKPLPLCALSLSLIKSLSLRVCVNVINAANTKTNYITARRQLSPTPPSPLTFLLFFLLFAAIVFLALPPCSPTLLSLLALLFLSVSRFFSSPFF